MLEGFGLGLRNIVSGNERSKFASFHTTESASIEPELMFDSEAKPWIETVRFDCLQNHMAEITVIGINQDIPLAAYHCGRNSKKQVDFLSQPVFTNIS